jgi:hypothetical protein
MGSCRSWRLKIQWATSTKRRREGGRTHKKYRNRGRDPVQNWPYEESIGKKTNKIKIYHFTRRGSGGGGGGAHRHVVHEQFYIYKHVYNNSPFLYTQKCLVGFPQIPVDRYANPNATIRKIGVITKVCLKFSHKYL